MAAVPSLVTAGIDATLSKSQPQEHPTSLEDGWRHVEDDPLQLNSSADHDMQSGHQTDDGDDYTHELMHVYAGTRSTEPSSQQIPAKASLLRRPESSHEDPAAGFTFTKAKPAPPLDFSRKITSNAILPPKDPTSPTTIEHVTQGSHESVPNAGESPAALSPADKSRSPGSPPKQGNALPKPFLVPFPEVAAKVSQGFRPSGSNSLAGQKSKSPPSKVPAPNEISMSGDDTLVEADPHGTSPPADRNDPLEQNEKFLASASIVHDQLYNTANRVRYQQQTISRDAGTSFELPEEAARPRSKRAKSRTKQGTAPNQARIAHPSSRNVLPPEGDLLEMLLFKHKQNGQERKTLQQALQAKESEYEELYAASEDLYAQLQQMSQRCKEYEAQLTKIKEAKPGWETKIRKLSDYVRGLTNDHNRLRDDAKDIRERQGSVLKDKQSILDTLREVYKVTEERYSTSKQQVTEARHDLQVLRQTVDNQETHLRQGESLLSAEREKNIGLEEQISTLTVSQAQVLETYTAERDSMTMKITELLQTFDQVSIANMQASQDHLRPMLEQCISMLEGLPRSSGGVEPADMQKLNDSIKGHLTESLGLMANYEQGATEIKQQQQRMESSISEQLHVLENSIATQQTLFQQTMDLREIKATVTERLQGTEAALQEARTELSRLRQKDSEQLAKMAALEESSRNRQPAEDPKIILRLHELDALNKDIRKDLTDKATEADALYERIRENEEETQQLKDRMSGVQTKLEEARGQTEVLKQEKGKYQQLAAQEREQMRQLLSRAADQELEDLKNQHLNELRQLKLKRSPSAEKFKEASLQLIMMKNENERLKNEAADKEAALEAEQKQKEDQATLASQLRHRVNELELQSVGKDVAREKLQHLLEDRERDSRAKESYIKKLRKAAAKKATGSPSNRDPNGAQAPQSRPPVVVDDSQPNGYPNFANHAEIMSEKGGSQDLAPDQDFSGFFPATPKGQTNDLEISHVTYSSTRVTSRDGMDNSERQQSEQGHPFKAPSRSGSQTNTPSTGRRAPSLAAGRSQSSIPGSQSDFGKSPFNAGHTQCSSQVSGSFPRSILKPTTQDVRGEKRNADELGSSNTAGFIGPKKRKSDMTKDLGPIVEDSQPPVNVISSRARKQTLPRRPRKDDKFSRAFAEHLT